MNQHYYKIAGQCIEIRYENGEGLAPLQDFEIDEGELAPAIRIKVNESTGAFFDCYGITYFRADDVYTNVFLSQKYPKIRMVTDQSYENAVIEGYESGLVDGIMELLFVDVYSWLAQRGWTLIHASCVEYAGNGLIFTGRSGIGKTTQAELWKQYLGAEILNGDKVLLTKGTENGMIAWGSPWCGSSAYAANRSVPLKAVIVLRQGQGNQIQLLSGMEKLKCVAPNVFYPFWDRKCLEKSMNMMDLLGALPVYLLTCRPEEEAVQLTLNTVLVKAAE